MKAGKTAGARGRDGRSAGPWRIGPGWIGASWLLVAACTPTVQVQAPTEPIEINLNVKIEQEVRVKVERDLQDVFAEDPDLFGLGGTETRQ